MRDYKNDIVYTYFSVDEDVKSCYGSDAVAIICNGDTTSVDVSVLPEKHRWESLWKRKDFQKFRAEMQQKEETIGFFCVAKADPCYGNKAAVLFTTHSYFK
jgi:hypothetical protein